MAQATAVIWTEKALQMLSEIAVYLADSTSVQKANQFQIDLINDMDNKLLHFPESCPPCRFLKLRQAGCHCCTYKKKNIVIYIFEEGVVQIIGVIGAKRSPAIFDDLI